MTPQSLLELIYLAIIGFALLMALIAYQDNRRRKQIGK